MSTSETTQQAVGSIQTTEPETVEFDDKDSRKDQMEATVEEIVGDLVDAAKEARESDAMDRFLDARAAFHDYSFRNAMLIKMQKPDATRVAGYSTWDKEFDRHVKEGENAIWIWRPNTVTSHKCPQCGNAPSYHAGNAELDCKHAGEDSDPDEWNFDPVDEWERGEILCGFSPAPVFDVSQTEGEPLPEIDTAATGDASGLLEPVLEAGRDSLGVDVSVVPADEWSREAEGICRHTTPPTIEVKERTDAATIKTLLHEYAHAELHVGEFVGVERDARELEAEAVAYVVGRQLGLNVDNSANYVAVWAGDDAEQIRNRLDRITETAKTIREAINK